MKWKLGTKERTYIGTEENKRTLVKRKKLRKHMLETAEHRENYVGHNNY